MKNKIRREIHSLEEYGLPHILMMYIQISLQEAVSIKDMLEEETFVSYLKDRVLRILELEVGMMLEQESDDHLVHIRREIVYNQELFELVLCDAEVSRVLMKHIRDVLMNVIEMNPSIDTSFLSSEDKVVQAQRALMGDVERLELLKAIHNTVMDATRRMMGEE